MSRFNKNLRGKKKQAESQPEPTGSDPIQERADELFKNKGGNVLLRNVNLMHKTLYYHESQIDKLNAGEEVVLLLSPFVAMQYLRHFERTNEKVIALQAECLELAKAELAPAVAAETGEPDQSNSSVEARVTEESVAEPTKPAETAPFQPQAPPTAA